MLSCSVSAAMRQYSAEIDNSQWTVEATARLKCELTHPIPQYGVARFITYASKQQNLDFVLDGLRLPAVYDNAEVVSVPPAWRPGVRATTIGSMSLKKQFDPEAPMETAWFILTELEKGMKPTVFYADWQNPNDQVSVGLSSANFHNAYSDFVRCTSGLLPYNFEDIAYTVLNYQSNSDELTKQSRRRLEMIAEYLNNDKDLELVLVDAYTDSYGGRWPNLKLSERRANRVKSYFMEWGIDEGRIDVEGHGEKKHIASNQSTLGRGKNRRVVIRMTKP